MGGLHVLILLCNSQEIPRCLPMLNLKFTSSQTNEDIFLL